MSIQFPTLEPLYSDNKNALLGKLVTIFGGAAENSDNESALLTKLVTLANSASGDSILPFNVKSYGAVGDGVADDSEAIQAAVDAADSATSPGSVYFPPGTYKGNFTLPGRVTIIGARAAGRVEAFGGTPWTILGETRLIPADTSLPVIKVPSLFANEIRNMRIMGGGAYITDSIGIDVTLEDTGFSGIGMLMDGVEVNGFEIGVRYRANRGLFIHCSFVSCLYGFKDTTTGSGNATDSITFINCAGGGAMETSEGVFEAEFSRTNFGWHLTGTCKGVGFLGCEMGQCGTALYLGSGGITCNVSASNFEGNDTCAIQLFAGQLTVSGCNSFSVDQPFVDVTHPYPLSSLTLLNNLIDTSYGAIIRAADGGFKPTVAPTGLIEYTDTYTRKVSTSREMLRVIRATSDQSITTGGTDFTVVFNTVLYAISPAGDHFNTTYGEWRCPRTGRYRFRVRMRFAGLGGGSYWYIATAATQNGATSGAEGTIMRYHGAVDDYDYLTGEIETGCNAGTFYRLMGVSFDSTFTIEADSDGVTGGSETEWEIQELSYPN